MYSHYGRMSSGLFLRKEGEYFCFSFRRTRKGDEILYFYSPDKTLDLNTIEEGSLEIPSEKKISRKTLGNIIVAYRYEGDGMQIDIEDLDHFSADATPKSKEEFKQAVFEIDRGNYWETVQARAERRVKGPDRIREIPYPNISEMQTIIAPLHRVVLVKYKTGNEEHRKKEILIVFANHPDHSRKMDDKVFQPCGRIFQWLSIEKINGRRYKILSKGTNELYEGEFSTGPDLRGSRDASGLDQTVIEIDGLRLPWSFQSDEMAGYVYYDDENYSIKITKYSTIDEYLKGLEQIEQSWPDV